MEVLEALEFDVLLQSLNLLWAEFATIRDQFASFFSATGCARWRNPLVRAALHQRLTDLGLFREREAGLK